MSSAQKFNGTQLKRAQGGSPDVFQAIAEITGFDGPSMSAPEIDVSNSDSSWAEKLVGLPDGGQVTFQYNWLTNNAQHAAVRADFAAGTLRSYQIALPDGTVFGFQAYITGMSPSGALNEKIAGSMTLTISGAVTF